MRQRGQLSLSCVITQIIFTPHLTHRFNRFSFIDYFCIAFPIASTHFDMQCIVGLYSKTVCFLSIRYPPSSRQTSHEEGKEWLRSHSTGGLQDTGSPLSPPGTAGTNAGKYHYSNLRMSRTSELFFTTFQNICLYVIFWYLCWLQWVPPMCPSSISLAPVWVALIVFQHTIRSSSTGRDTLWAEAPHHWKSGRAAWADPALFETAQMKVSITTLHLKILYPQCTHAQTQHDMPLKT